MSAHIKNILSEVFERFYITIFKDLYASNFLRSYSMISRLISHQASFLERALSSSTSREVIFEYYLTTARVHWNLRIHEKAIFDMIEFLQEELWKVREKLPRSARERIPEVISIIKETNAEAYIEGILKDALTVLGSGSGFVIDDHVLWLEKFYRALFEKESPPEFNPQRCTLGRWLHSLTFEVMCYRASSLRIKILSTHKDLHEAARLAYTFYINGHKEKALPLVRVLCKNLFLLSSFLGELLFRWESSNVKILLDFMKEESLLGGLFLITLNRALIQLRNNQEETDGLRMELSQSIRESFGNNEGFCLVETNGNLYLLVDTRRFPFSKIRAWLDEKARDLARKFACRVKNPILCVGLIDPERLRSYSVEEIQELLTLAEEYLASLDEPHPLLVEDLTPHLEEFFVRVRRYLKIKRLVQKALEKQEVILYLQPLHILSSGKASGWFECLVRLKDEEDHIISAGEFIPIVARENWQEPFDLVVVKMVLSRLGDIAKFAKKIFINLYPRSFSSEEVLDVLRKLALRAEELNVGVVVEVTEYEELSKPDFVNKLRSDNMQFAVDDFGTGYANFELIGRLTEEKIISFVKIDGSLVKRALHSESIRSVLDSVVLLALDLGLQVVYEFVENRELIGLLQSIPERLRAKTPKNRKGEDFLGQGYFYSKPASLESWLEKGK